MSKVLATLMAAAFIILQGCTNVIKSPTEYTEYTLQIINECPTEIHNLHFEMIGSDDSWEITTLSQTKNPLCKIFSLPATDKNQTPISWGDISGLYTVNGFTQDILIRNYEYGSYKNITITIGSESYEISFSGHQ